MKHKRKYPGIFITFEGCEGSGKTTHIDALRKFLVAKGYKVVQTREPGGTVISEKIRHILLDTDHKKMQRICELLLYQASRAQLATELIIPALKQGAIVLCDRYQDATYAYQGDGAGVDKVFIRILAEYQEICVTPDATILMDIEVKKGLGRSVSKDRMDQKACAFHRRVRKGYLRLAKKYPERIHVIKVKDEYTVNQEKIRKVIVDVIARHTGK